MRVSPHSALGSGHLSPELASLEWFQFSVVSAEFLHMRFNSMALCHQVCFVRIRVHMSKSRLLLLHDIFVLQHDMISSVLTHVWMPTVDMVHDGHFVSQFIQQMFRHHPFGNSCCQSIQFCVGGTEAHRLLCSSPCRKGFVSSSHNFTACALVSHGLPCSVAVCVHVQGLRKHNDFNQALCLTSSHLSTFV